MDIKIDPKKMSHILSSILRQDSCPDNNCSHCQLQRDVQAIAGYDIWLQETLVIGRIHYQDWATYPLNICFLVGILAAWEYRNMLELERMMGGNK